MYPNTAISHDIPTAEVSHYGLARVGDDMWLFAQNAEKNLSAAWAEPIVWHIEMNEALTISSNLLLFY